ncbi:hypothetical protein Q73_08570 [Bacillus coahuilensis m2-6]|uniref:YqkE family protein n=1 Tax=Bacillus coahuilensis TaxID=408580 RepID=UPI0007502651|nr:YqkE family protein [Bacillus coahuilensis]KUP07693.1 hypothetical protein Q73_08570 [Bacillus coahuilensis m2-6]
MKKKKDTQPTLADSLNSQLLDQLKQTKKDLQVEEEKKRVAEQKRKELERIEREKNKSFEELLNESSHNWKDYK